MTNKTQSKDNNTITIHKKRNDHLWLILVVAILVVIGILAIWSCTPMKKLDNQFFYIKRHFFNIFLGFVVFFITSKINYKKYQKICFPLYIFTFILLLLPPFFPEQNGAHRWITLPGFNFQPSEFAKIVMILITADFLARRKDKINIWKYDIVPFSHMFFFCGAIALLQRDLGSTALISILWFTLLIVAKIDTKRFFTMIGIYSLALPTLIIVEPYRLKRITDYLKYGETAEKVVTEIDNMQAAFAAFGSGGFLGKGAGQSEMKLKHLPEMHTDFIFPIIGEEYGFLGTIITIGLFILFTKVAISINKNCKDDFGKFVSLGIMLIISSQAIINMAMTTGVFPAKGFPLPFISYGGSSMLINFFMIGILYNIARSNNKQI